MVTALQENFLSTYLGVTSGDGAIGRDADLLAKGGPEGLADAVRAELAATRIANLRAGWDSACSAFASDVAAVTDAVRSAYIGVPDAGRAVAGAGAKLKTLQAQIAGQLDAEIDQFLHSPLDGKDALRNKIATLQQMIASDLVAQSFDDNEFSSSARSVATMTSALSAMAATLPA